MEKMFVLYHREWREDELEGRQAWAMLGLGFLSWWPQRGTAKGFLWSQPCGDGCCSGVGCPEQSPVLPPTWTHR